MIVRRLLPEPAGKRAVFCVAAACLAMVLFPQERTLFHDPGFESVPAGPLEETGVGRGWEIQKTGRDVIKGKLVVACVSSEKEAKSGKNCISLTIPKETVGFEFVTVGQQVQLEAGTEYEASAWVRWKAGPDEAPKGASPVSGHPSAIVSFWARHREGKGDFAGRDEWIFDNRWRLISFRFRATDPDRRTLVYVSLLPNQKPAETTVLLDDFEVKRIDDPAEAETRRGNLVQDPGFAGAKSGKIASPWSFANMGGTGIAGTVEQPEGSAFVKIAMGPGTSNFESAQLWQHLKLKEGARYEVSCRLRWDTFAPDAPAPIVNYGIYHGETNTWYGPIDQVMRKTRDWETYRFVHVPPHGGRWKLYLQLNGWGNFGKGVTVSVDDVSVTPH